MNGPTDPPSAVTALINPDDADRIDPHLAAEVLRVSFTLSQALDVSLDILNVWYFREEGLLRSWRLRTPEPEIIEGKRRAAWICAIGSGPRSGDAFARSVLAAAGLPAGACRRGAGRYRVKRYARCRRLPRPGRLGSTVQAEPGRGIVPPVADTCRHRQKTRLPGLGVAERHDAAGPFRHRHNSGRLFGQPPQKEVRFLLNRD